MPDDTNDKRFWCLQSQLTGKLILRDAYVDDGHLDMRGPIGVYWSREEAELDAIAHRDAYPALLIEAVPLPVEVPELTYPARHKDDQVAAAQLRVVLDDQVVIIELRPEIMTESSALIGLLHRIIKQAAAAMPSARVSPLQLISLGPIGVQVDVRPPATASDSEAA